MKILSKILFFIAVTSVGLQLQAGEIFARDAALSKYKAQCQLNLVLAMGLSAQKQSGDSKRKLKEVASKSKNPELMKPMVEELFEQPELKGHTYTFYSFDNCLISAATSREPVPLTNIRPSLLQCEDKYSEMEDLISCIDSSILSYGQDS